MQTSNDNSALKLAFWSMVLGGIACIALAWMTDVTVPYDQKDRVFSPSRQAHQNKLLITGATLMICGCVFLSRPTAGTVELDDAPPTDD